MRAFLLGVGVVGALAALCFPAAAEADQKFRIVNDARTEINARVRMYSDDFTRISVGNEATMKLPTGRSTAGVEIKTRKKWERCFVYAFPGAIVVAKQDHAKLICRVMR
ncbi:MAG: hypothetical protein NXI16_15360 [Alphaproteobacteria bacterium]|nr:hypothetical protein [Alphaproteobacteria bacterium]